MTTKTKPASKKKPREKTPKPSDLKPETLKIMLKTGASVEKADADRKARRDAERAASHAAGETIRRAVFDDEDAMGVLDDFADCWLRDFSLSNYHEGRRSLLGVLAVTEGLQALREKLDAGD